MAKKSNKRRGRGEGSIHERPDGRWRGTVSLGYDGNGKRRRVSVFGATKDEVQKKLRELQTRADAGVVGPEDKVRVGDYLKQWLDVKKGTVGEKTFLPYEQHVRLHLSPTIGGIRLKDLSPIHVQRMYSDLENAGLSRAMQRRVGTTLRTALAYAVSPLCLIRSNPAANVPKPRHTPQEMTILNIEQMRLFLDAAKEDDFYALYALALDSGARQGELLALTWADVNFEARTVSITKALEESRGHFRIKEPKTAKSKRKVVITSATIEALADHRRRMLAGKEANVEANTLARKPLACRPEDPIFANARGGWVSKPNLVQRSFKPIIERANAEAKRKARKSGVEPILIPGIRFHDLRHTAASILLASGVSPKVVSERLGHSKTSMTLDVYSHVLPGQQEQAAGVLEKLFRP